MARPPKTELRIHYIPEWADHRGLRQTDIVEALQGRVDKSTVSRWFAGSLPAGDHLQALQGIFALDEAASMFRHPDDDWMARFFAGRDADERYRIRQMLEAAFPKAS